MINNRVGDFSIDHSMDIKNDKPNKNVLPLKIIDRVLITIYKINIELKKLATSIELKEAGFSDTDIYNSVETAIRTGLLENEMINLSYYNWSLTQKGYKYVQSLF